MTLSQNERHIIWKKKNNSKTAIAVKYYIPNRAFKIDTAN